MKADLVALAAQQQLLQGARTELRDLLERCTPVDLTLEEVLALIAVVRPAAQRVVTPQFGRGPRLQIVRWDVEQ